MDYFHTDEQTMVEWLADVFAQAAEHKRPVRILTRGNDLMLKVGGGGWTAPFKSTPDPYRDLRVERPTIVEMREPNTLHTIIS